MRYCITGATGLLGGNLAIMLLEAGHEVVATKRASSNTDHLSNLNITWVEAPLSDTHGLTRAFEGCDGVFHCAAAVSVLVKIEPWIYEANVTGTQNVIDAVKAAGVPRLLHCSTVGAVGLSLDGQPCDEGATWNMPDFGLGDAYVTTKHQAQELVLKAVAAGGLDAVIVNPTYMIGPHDAKLSSGKLVAELVLGKVPGYTLGKNNFVDVRDVARGMVQAFEKGNTGELYILSGHNMTYKAFMDTVCQQTGAKPITRRVPNWLGRIVGIGGDLQHKLTGKEPLLNTATIRWSQTDRFIFKSDKAKRELGYTISPIEPAIKDAAAWFRQHGHLPPA